MSAGGTFACALLDNGAVWCWWSNYFGEVGDGASQGTMSWPRAVDLGLGRAAVAVSAGNYGACARLANSAMKCWGNNWYGQLGLGDTVIQTGIGDNLPAVDLGTGRSAVELASGDSRNCALLENGTVKCWGGQLLRLTRPRRHESAGGQPRGNGECAPRHLGGLVH